jgi:hypothetical protein
MSLARIDPALLEVLQDIDDKRRRENIRRSTVTIEDVEETPEAETPAQEEQNQ